MDELTPTEALIGPDASADGDDLTVRAATPEDAAEICRMLNTIDILELGHAETDLGIVEVDLVHPEADLPHNSWLAFRNGSMVAYGLLWDDSGADRIDADHYVLPDHQDAGERVLAAIETRAAERAAENGATRAVVHLNLNIRPSLDRATLARRGWHTVRRYHVLTRPLSRAADPAPTPPPGLTLRDCAAEADRRRAHALVQETFVGHHDHQARTYQQWLDDLGEGMDWSLVWVASLAGTGDVAVVVTRDDRAAMAWVPYLGVREDARGRGIAGHLLRHSFAVYAACGRDTIGLGVDTENATGALDLYTAHGLGLHYAVDTWEVTLPTPR
ncbi:acetyltransferase [Streptomyces alboflavus]|uniref:Acetyltransferase n=1 Tax=Streptomyces alboflavus TaxID=67267 RepID=A0A1Z1W5B9_9ACTN|nr:GNAT family N-acetyltransferase [Streptomyces alboflavus]ARX81625.1 acetyltransferase [Streptomyces alboflavus]